MDWWPFSNIVFHHIHSYSIFWEIWRRNMCHVKTRLLNIILKAKFRQRNPPHKFDKTAMWTVEVFILYIGIYNFQSPLHDQKKAGHRWVKICINHNSDKLPVGINTQQCWLSEAEKPLACFQQSGDIEGLLVFGSEEAPAFRQKQHLDQHLKKRDPSWPDAQKTMADIHCGGPLAKTALWYTESTMFLCSKFNVYIYIYNNYIQLYYNVTLSTTRCYFPIALVDFHILSQRFPRTSHLFCFPRGWRHGPVARKTPCSASEILLLGVSRTPSRCSGANFLRKTQQCKLVNLSICWKQWKTILVSLSIY